MNTQEYLQKVDSQLTDINTYHPILTDDTLQVKRKADELVHSLYNSKLITYKQRRYLMNFKAKTPIFLWYTEGIQKRCSFKTNRQSD